MGYFLSLCFTHACFQQKRSFIHYITFTVSEMFIISILVNLHRWAQIKSLKIQGFICVCLGREEVIFRILTWKSSMREFPGGLVVRIPGFHCWGRVQSLVGKLRSCKPCGAAKKKKKICEKFERYSRKNWPIAKTKYILRSVFTCKMLQNVCKNMNQDQFYFFHIPSLHIESS